MDREKAFAKALSQYRNTCAEFFGLIKDEEKAKIRRWEDEKPSLELLITSLNQTCEILKKEKKRLVTELTAKQGVTGASSGSTKVRQGPNPSQADSSSHHGVKDALSLQRELDELNSRIQATDIEIKVANQELASCERADEREYLSTKCVVLQDTRRILLEELHSVRSSLSRLEAAVAAEEGRRRGEAAGWGQVAGLDAALERTVGRLDRVKQQLFFPDVKGYRFSSGSGGIYIAARDLHLSEVSGRFEFMVEPVGQQNTQHNHQSHSQTHSRQQRSSSATGAGAGGGAGAGAGAASSRVARLTVALGGVSATTALAERSDSRRGMAGAAPTASTAPTVSRSSSSASLPPAPPSGGGGGGAGCGPAVGPAGRVGSNGSGGGGGSEPQEPNTLLSTPSLPPPGSPSTSVQYDTGGAGCRTSSSRNSLLQSAPEPVWGGLTAAAEGGALEQQQMQGHMQGQMHQNMHHVHHQQPQPFLQHQHPLVAANTPTTSTPFGYTHPGMADPNVAAAVADANTTSVSGGGGGGGGGSRSNSGSGGGGGGGGSGSNAGSPSGTPASSRTVNPAVQIASPSLGGGPRLITSGGGVEFPDTPTRAGANGSGGGGNGGSGGGGGGSGGGSGNPGVLTSSYDPPAPYTAAVPTPAATSPPAVLPDAVSSPRVSPPPAPLAPGGPSPRASMEAATAAGGAGATDPRMLAAVAQGQPQWQAQGLVGEQQPGAHHTPPQGHASLAHAQAHLQPQPQNSSLTQPQSTQQQQQYSPYAQQQLYPQQLQPPPLSHAHAHYQVQQQQHLHQQHHLNQQQLQNQQHHHQRHAALQPTISEPPPQVPYHSTVAISSTAAPPSADAAAAVHRRASSSDTMTASAAPAYGNAPTRMMPATVGGPPYGFSMPAQQRSGAMLPPPLPYGQPSQVAPPPPRPRGEGVSMFLSGLKSKKDKLKSLVGGLVDKAGGIGAQGPAASPRGTAGGGGGGGASSGPASWEGGGGGATPGSGWEEGGGGGVPSAGGRLRTQMMEKLQDGLSESKGKLSRLGKAIAAKAPEALRDMRNRTAKAPPGSSGLGGLQRDSTTSIASMNSGGGGVGGFGGGESGEWEAAGSTSSTTSTPRYSESSLMAPAASVGDLITDNVTTAAVPPGGGGALQSQLGGQPQQQQQAGAGPGVAGAGMGGGEAAAGGGGGGGVADEDGGLLGGFEEDFGCRPSRKGVYVQLLGEGVELLGERGTKVPDTSIREFMLEVEVAVTAVFEYHAPATPAPTSPASPIPTSTSLAGGTWIAPEPVSFNILQLEHRMRGASLPLPRTLIKGLLNAYLPGLLTRVLSGLLPPELGSYTAASGDSRGGIVSGEFKVAGPSLGTTLAALGPPGKPPNDPAKRAKWATAAAAGARARAMLGLSEGQAAALCEVFGGGSGGGGRSGVLPEAAGLSASISGLCRFFVTYSSSGLWQPLMGLLDRVLQTAFEFHGVPQAERFPLRSFFDGAVTRLCRKPLRIAFALERLHVALDADVGLATLRDYFERLAREYEAKGPSGSSQPASSSPSHDPLSGPPREPLSVQLELLDLWSAALGRSLRAFKERFRSAGATLLASADRRVFAFGAESVAYDGPLKLKLPLDLAMDPDGSFLLDVKLPDREQAAHSITSLLTEVMYSLSATHNNTSNIKNNVNNNNNNNNGNSNSAATGNENTGGGNYQPTSAATAAAGGESVRHVVPPSQAAAVQAVVAHAAAVQGMLASGGGGGAAAGEGAAAAPPLTGMLSALYDISHVWAAALAEGMPEGSALAAGTAPLLANPVVGQLCVKKLALSLRLDEQRVAQLLSGAVAPAATSTFPTRFPSAAATAASADIVGRLLGCYGDLFTARLDKGWRPAAAFDAGSGSAGGGNNNSSGGNGGAAAVPCCMLTVASNDITRLRAEVEGLWFQSSVSPRLAVRVLQAVVIALVLKFQSTSTSEAGATAAAAAAATSDSGSVRFWNRFFNQLHEYLSRGSLDLAVCLSLRAVMDRDTDRLRVALSGQDLNGGVGGGGGVRGGSGGGGGGGGGLLGRVCPVHLLNDVNLLTVLDSVKLLSEAGAPPAGVAAGFQQQQTE